MISSGIKPVTFQLAAYCLIQICYHVLPHVHGVLLN
jgi:hypothetical protein